MSDSPGRSGVKRPVEQGSDDEENNGHQYDIQESVDLLGRMCPMWDVKRIENRLQFNKNNVDRVKEEMIQDGCQLLEVCFRVTRILLQLLTALTQ